LDRSDGIARQRKALDVIDGELSCKGCGGRSGESVNGSANRKHDPGCQGKATDCHRPFARPPDRHRDGCRKCLTSFGEPWRRLGAKQLGPRTHERAYNPFTVGALATRLTFLEMRIDRLTLIRRGHTVNTCGDKRLELVTEGHKQPSAFSHQPSAFSRQPSAPG
jgi:hypothetical protein